jgi:hypothetical protein
VESVLSRKNVLLAGLGLSVGVILALGLALQRPVLPPEHDLAQELAQAFAQVQSGELSVSTPGKVSPIVLAADGIPQRNAPSFLPRKIFVEGAAPFVALQRRAVLVAYRGDAEGRFAVASLKAGAEDLPQEHGTLRDRNRDLVTFERTLPGNQVIRGVGQAQGARWVFVIGPQPLTTLGMLADMIPPL